MQVNYMVKIYGNSSSSSPSTRENHTGPTSEYVYGWWMGQSMEILQILQVLLENPTNPHRNPTNHTSPTSYENSREN